MLFKKNKKEIKELRLEKFWDDVDAKQAYRLVEYVFIDGKIQDYYFYKGTGDSDWANRQAKHYNLHITKPLKED